MQKFVLASSSKPRKEFLKKLGFEFMVLPVEVDEQADARLPPEKAVKRLALRKARLAARKASGIVVGFDSVAAMGQRVYGKPRTKERARVFLSELQGKEHSFYTGVAAINTETGKSVVRVSKTRVRMRPMSKKEIGEYLEKDEPLQAAGAYKIQGEGIGLIESLRGEYSNVLGVPVAMLIRVLNEVKE